MKAKTAKKYAAYFLAFESVQNRKTFLCIQIIFNKNKCPK